MMKSFYLWSMAAAVGFVTPNRISADAPLSHVEHFEFADPAGDFSEVPYDPDGAGDLVDAGSQSRDEADPFEAIEADQTSGEAGDFSGLEAEILDGPETIPPPREVVPALAPPPRPALTYAEAVAELSVFKRGDWIYVEGTDLNIFGRFVAYGEIEYLIKDDRGVSAGVRDWASQERIFFHMLPENGRYQLFKVQSASERQADLALEKIKTYPKR